MDFHFIITKIQMIKGVWSDFAESSYFLFIHSAYTTAHAAANLNSGYSKYAKAARVHYFCTIALRISRAVVTRA